MGINDENNESPLMLLAEGGGSHTHVYVTAAGSLIKEIALPSLNQVAHASGGPDDVIDRVVSLRKEFGTIDSVYLALGAAATPEYLNRLGEQFEQRWRAQELPWQRILITNDIVPMMFTEGQDANQLIVISGTGSGIAARTGFRRVVRGGANEYLLGDEGGAFDIGRHGLRAVLQMKETRGRPTVLDDLANVWSNRQELNWFVYESKNHKQTIASFAPWVFEADGNGDTVAGEILDRAARDLVEISNVALARLGRPRGVTVTCTGTLLSEPTGRLYSRLRPLLLQIRGVDKCEIRTVDSTLLRCTAETLFSSFPILTEIAREIPARSY